MGLWLLRRVGQVIPTLLILSILIFGLQQLMPGDPAVILAGEERGDPQVLAQIRAELGLDKPIWQQYLLWIGKVLTGDFGFSWRIRVPVSELILTKLPVTFQLATMAFIIAILIGVPLGIVSAVRKDTPADWAANGAARRALAGGDGGRCGGAHAPALPLRIAAPPRSGSAQHDRAQTDCGNRRDGPEREIRARGCVRRRRPHTTPGTPVRSPSPVGSRPSRDPGAHSATAPIPPAAASASVHGAKAKPADAGAGV